jgi:hypothetical protein
VSKVPSPPGTPHSPGTSVRYVTHDCLSLPIMGPLANAAIARQQWVVIRGSCINSRVLSGWSELAAGRLSTGGAFRTFLWRYRVSVRIGAAHGSACRAACVRSDRGPDAQFLSPAFLLFLFVPLVVLAISCWKLFEKAGHPGWAILIPIYNAYILLKIAGRRGSWLLLYLIPLVNLAVSIIVATDVAKNFGQGAASGFFLNFLLGGIDT